MVISLGSLVFSRPLFSFHSFLFHILTGIIRACQTNFVVAEHKFSYLKIYLINLTLSYFHQFHNILNYYYLYLITHPQYLTSRDTLLARSSRIKRVDNSEGFRICCILFEDDLEFERVLNFKRNISISI